MRIAISAGELSGDEHAAGLVSAIKQFRPGVAITGMGGRNLRAAGAETIVDSEKSASVMGFHEVVASGGKVYRAWKTMRDSLRQELPDLLILVDYPDFNLRLAREAHSLGIKVFYFITPQIWAWRTGRVELFKRYIAAAAVIFPFERLFFHQHGYGEAVFVGHPFNDLLPMLADKLRSPTFKRDLCERLGLDGARPIFTIFPGSRKNELARHLPVLRETVSLLLQRHPGVQVCLGAADSVTHILQEEADRGRLGCKVIEGASLDLLCASDAALLKSGTSNLHGAFVGLPFSMFFNASKLSAFIARHFLHIDRISIVNVVRDDTIREILQEAVTGSELADEAERLLFDASYRTGIRERLKLVVNDLNSFDPMDIFQDCRTAYERAARVAVSIIAR